jgi:hypothetical protein
LCLHKTRQPCFDLYRFHSRLHLTSCRKPLTLLSVQVATMGWFESFWSSVIRYIARFFKQFLSYRYVSTVRWMLLSQTTSLNNQLLTAYRLLFMLKTTKVRQSSRDGFLPHTHIANAQYTLSIQNSIESDVRCSRRDDTYIVRQ